MTKGERIRISREKAGLTQVDLAERIGVSKQNMYKYENNIITNIPSDKIEIMAEILDVSPSYIMGWDSSKKLIFGTEPAPKDTITPHEKEIISAYRDSSEDTRIAVCKILEVDYIISEEKAKKIVGK